MDGNLDNKRAPVRTVYNKLIRDRIPDNIIKKGGIPETRILSDEEFLSAALTKIVEEAREVEEAGIAFLKAATEAERAVALEKLLGEFADLQEISSAARSAVGLGEVEVIAAQARKNSVAGRFYDKLLLVAVTE